MGRQLECVEQLFAAGLLKLDRLMQYCDGQPLTATVLHPACPTAAVQRPPLPPHSNCLPTAPLRHYSPLWRPTGGRHHGGSLSSSTWHRAAKCLSTSRGSNPSSSNSHCEVNPSCRRWTPRPGGSGRAAGRWTTAPPPTKTAGPTRQVRWLFQQGTPRLARPLQRLCLRLASKH